MKFCPECGYHFTAETEKFCPSCGYEVNKGAATAARERDSVNIENTRGNVFGVGVSGSGHIIGNNIVVGSGTINVSETELRKIPNEYAQALKKFSENINQQLKGKQIPEEEVKSINDNMDELAKEVEDIKPGKEGEQEIDYVKQTQVESKTASLVQRVLKVLPEAAETAATFTPLAPFSKLIGKGTQQIVDTIARRKRS
jgi:DNA-directed RNA polymerase subunit M/transcription elongation factor TFIIS